MEREDKPRANTVLLTIIAVATLLVAVIGATFAYFSATITGNDSPSTSVIVKTATLGITYHSGNEINIPNARPGDTQSKVITITNTGNISLSYRFNWEVEAYTFTDPTTEELANPEGERGYKADLVYTIEQLNNDTEAVTGTYVAETPIPSADAVIGSADVTIAANATNKYKLTVTFKNNGSNQNNNQGKQFLGSISVTSPEVSQ